MTPCNSLLQFKKKRSTNICQNELDLLSQLDSLTINCIEVLVVYQEVS